MKIKKQQDKPGAALKIFRSLSSRKNKILITAGIIALLAVFIVGTLFGLFVTGFFGTLDNPSPRAVSLLESMGFRLDSGRLGQVMRKGEQIVRGIINQNILLPVNYIKAKFSNPEKIYIDVAFEDYQKLAYKRDKALELGILISGEDDYVPATIRHDDETLRARIRLKGDWMDHLRTDKWSFRIKMRGDDKLFGMKVVSVQLPEARNYVHEIVFQEALRREGIIALRAGFIEVVVNGKNLGIYELEEHFDKILVENNRLREGPIIRFNEDVVWEQLAFGPEKDNDRIRVDNYMTSDIDSFATGSMMEDPVMYEQYLKAKNLLESFREGKLNASDIFDVEKLAKFYALSEIMGAEHGLPFGNLRFYYNPITSLLEPIGFDGEPGKPSPEPVFVDEFFVEPYYGTLFNDRHFFERYLQELERMSQKSYLDSIFEDMEDEIKRNVNIIRKDEPFYHFSNDIYYRHQENIRKYFNPKTAIQTYFIKSSDNTIVLETTNVQAMPIKIENLILNDTVLKAKKEYVVPPIEPNEIAEFEQIEFAIPQDFEWNDSFIREMLITYRILGTERIMNDTIFPWARVDTDFLEKDIIRQKPNMDKFDFIEVNKDLKSIIIKQGYWKVEESMIIPKGYTVFCNSGTVIDLVKDSAILSYSSMQLKGSENSLIRIVSSDGTGQGLAVLNAGSRSNLEYVVFDNLAAPSKSGWELTGAVTFYQSPVEFRNVFVFNSRAEDGINIVSSEFIMNSTFFNSTLSDCFDGDFVEGKIDGSTFIGCGNDAVDFSGSKVEIDGLIVINAGDKAISAGEQSMVDAADVFVNMSYICVASKDNSIINIRGIKMVDCDYGFAAYQKKPEFGPAVISLHGNTQVKDVGVLFILEEGSKIQHADKVVAGSEKKVYEKLYPME